MKTKNNKGPKIEPCGTPNSNGIRAHMDNCKHFITVALS